MSCKTIHYGSSEDQVGDLYLPGNKNRPVICLFHGGFWKMPYGRDQLDPVARDLVNRGYAVWNLEYRRIGNPTAGWPGTFDDAIHGIEYLSNIADDGIALDLNNVAIVGHSAGGHLALWAGATFQNKRQPRDRNCITIKAVVGEAPVADLKRAHELGTGNGTIAKLLGATPTERPDLYMQASPINLLPLRIRQLIIHGNSDDAVPVEISRTYAKQAESAGDAVTLLELAAGDHMDFVDPLSEAHSKVCEWLSAVMGSSKGA